MKRIKHIKEKLAQLKYLDKGFSIFGSGRHKYEWNSTLSDQEIRDIETNNHIVFPPEYKEILKHLGNGGAGCGYGLEKLALQKTQPPYMGTKQLLRNWEDPEEIDYDMVELDELSGYIKLFDYGCGMEYCLIVNGEEQGELFYFDCEGRFEKLAHNSLLRMYEKWLDSSLDLLQRIEQKLAKMALQEIIDSEWELQNFSADEMILSIIDAESISGAHSGNDKKIHLEKEYQKWKVNQQGPPEDPPGQWWQIWK